MAARGRAVAAVMFEERRRARGRVINAMWGAGAGAKFGKVYRSSHPGCSHLGHRQKCTERPVQPTNAMTSSTTRNSIFFLSSAISTSKTYVFSRNITQGQYFIITFQDVQWYYKYDIKTGLLHKHVQVQDFLAISLELG